MTTTTSWSKVAQAWTKDFLPSVAAATTTTAASKITPAIERAIPLLQDDPNGSAVPFVCRYRSDVIEPLSTKQIHQLSDYIQKYQHLESLRNKILPFLLLDQQTHPGTHSHSHSHPHSQQKSNREKATKRSNTTMNMTNKELIFRVETSISKSELEDIYSPFKPPNKGSLEDRIQNDYPHLIPAVDEFWSTGQITTTTTIPPLPRDAAVTILANRIASHIETMDVVMDYITKQCIIRVKQVKPTNRKKKKDINTGAGGAGTNSKNSKNSKIPNHNHNNDADKYKAYFDYVGKVTFLRDHQVLAIRRGGNQNVLKHGFEIDNDRVESIIGNILYNRQREQAAVGVAAHNTSNRNSRKNIEQFYNDAIHDAWTRLIRKKCTTRLWKQRCVLAEERAIDVFCDNLQKALLAPPPTISKRAILVLDPGFQAGIKCVILNSIGDVVVDSFQTVHFLGNKREQGKKKLEELLQSTKSICIDDENDDGKDEVCVVLGNGHGTRDARDLVDEVSVESGISINIKLVSEAGASVWSVTEMASNEFPKEKPSAVAAVSIGRRFQNPLNELVKIPPKSLGLGMYQHDLSEKDLDNKLSITSVNAVADVGVDINACSIEILKKVPSLTPSLCKKIVNARPLQSRSELLNISGVGPKTFESCAAFVRVHNGQEPLDSTLVHPESYDLARWLLKKLKFDLANPKSVKAVLTKSEQKKEWSIVVKKAAKRFNCTEERVFTVIEHLQFSITRPDPRLIHKEHHSTTTQIGSLTGCQALPSNMLTAEALKKACPLRNITATIRNVVDFGVFVDFGGENDGLIHRSKLGTVPIGSLLVGQEVGIDIVGVSKKSGKVSSSLSGLNLPLEDLDTKPSKRPNTSGRKSSEVKRQRRK